MVASENRIAAAARLKKVLDAWQTLRWEERGLSGRSAPRTAVDRFNDTNTTYVRHVFDRSDVEKWRARAARALEDVFQASDPLITRWRALAAHDIWDGGHVRAAHGLVEAALAEVEDGHVERMTASVRASSEYALIEQARAVCEDGDGWAAVATVIAGTALELRLRRVAVGRVALPAKATLGVIIKVLRERRDDGVATVDVADDSLLDRWLEMRNDAAHRMTTFKWTAEHIFHELGPLEAFIRRARTEHSGHAF